MEDLNVEQCGAAAGAGPSWQDIAEAMQYQFERRWVELMEALAAESPEGPGAH
jgi:hypothetical protein